MPMVVYTEDEVLDACQKAETEGAERSADMRDKYMFALQDLVRVIDAAGLHNLTRGVQLGPTVWYVKAQDAMEAAKKVLGWETDEERLARDRAEAVPATTI